MIVLMGLYPAGVIGHVLRLSGGAPRGVSR